MNKYPSSSNVFLICGTDRRHVHSAKWKTALQQKLDYLHDNPRRKGSVYEVTAWRFSSAGYWLGDVEEADLKLTGVAW